MRINGLHHATIINSDAQPTLDFYSGILGLRLIKQTVNFDDPHSYHLYFGDQAASHGSILSCFEWPNASPGNEGIGGTHHIALSTRNEESQLRWKRWLTDHGVPVTGPYNRVYFTSIYFRDPDGLILEIATSGPGFTVDESEVELGQTIKTPPPETMAGGRDEDEIAETTWPDPVTTIDAEMALSPIHHVTAIGSSEERLRRFYTDILGMRLVKQTVNFDNPRSPHIYFGVDDGAPGTVVTYFAYAHGTFRPFRMGNGVTHHFALSVENSDALDTWHRRLATAAVEVSDVRDRAYFQSIYFRDPDGQVIELATDEPGFTIDEDAGVLGQTLQLPPWLEPRRDEILSTLNPLTVSQPGDI
jgi:glyoxalase family protein